VSGASNAFRDRKVLFAVLLLVVAANAGVLLSYRTFYDERLQSLLSEQAELEKSRDEARAKTEAAAASERALFEKQEALTAFFAETLGKRAERIAPLIEEIYKTTREAGLRPDSIGYSSVDEPGADALTMTFAVEGTYEGVKKLLAGLERSRRFLVVEQLALSAGSDVSPDTVRVGFTVTNYFRPDSLRPIRRVRAVRGTATRPGLVPPKARSSR
jgi:Tfp pilus assembly protein PilO